MASQSATEFMSKQWRKSDTITVMVVGGDEHMVRGSLTRQLKPFGVRIGWHANRTPKLPVVPAACQGIIVITDFVAHNLMWSAKEEAKRLNLPISCVPHQWTTARAALERDGFLRDPGLSSIPAPVVAIAPTVPVFSGWMQLDDVAEILNVPATRIQDWISKGLAHAELRNAGNARWWFLSHLEVDRIMTLRTVWPGPLDSFDLEIEIANDNKETPAMMPAVATEPAVLQPPVVSEPDQWLPGHRVVAILNVHINQLAAAGRAGKLVSKAEPQPEGRTTVRPAGLLYSLASARAWLEKTPGLAPMVSTEQALQLVRDGWVTLRQMNGLLGLAHPRAAENQYGRPQAPIRGGVISPLGLIMFPPAEVERLRQYVWIGEDGGYFRTEYGSLVRNPSPPQAVQVVAPLAAPVSHPMPVDALMAAPVPVPPAPPVEPVANAVAQTVSDMLATWQPSAPAVPVPLPQPAAAAPARWLWLKTDGPTTGHHGATAGPATYGTAEEAQAALLEMVASNEELAGCGFMLVQGSLHTVVPAIKKEVVIDFGAW